MNRNKIIEILKQDYPNSKHTVESIMSGRRKPNAELRYKYDKNEGIPFDAWGKNLKNFIKGVNNEKILEE